MFLDRHFPGQSLPVKGGLEPKSVQCDVCYSFYLIYFNDNFNYGFGSPRTDLCGKCVEYDAKLSTEKNAATKKNLETEQCLHKQKAKAFYTKLTHATAEAEEMEDVETIAIGFEQNLYPHQPIGEIFLHVTVVAI